MLPDPGPAIHDPARLAALHRLQLLDSLPEESFDRATRLATQFLQAPVALVSLLDIDRQYFKSSVGLAEPWASRRQTPLSHSFCQYPVATRQPLVIADARRDSVLRHNLAIPDLGVVAYAGIPLVTAAEQAIGTLCVIDTQPRAWTEAELAALRDLAAMVMTELALRDSLLVNAELLSAMRQLTITDELTGLYNRRGLFELGAREIERSRRMGAPLTGLLMDVDHFKAINDAHGHQVGDEVLRAIAARCRDVLRKIDLIGRYGGEELAVLLAWSDGPTGCLVADRLRLSVAQTPILTAAGPIAVTMSVGAVELTPALSDVAALLNSADQALYQAKQTGRNCVVLA